jgi:hypothetical protein
MRRRALWIAGTLAAIAVASTTAEERAEARRRFARWSPLFLALIIIMLAFVFWPRD